ncbi:MAG TPA: alpha-L-fucosidase [Terriglobia bacterium]|nr:alpha-L-fucosidase [Terriglobia bacterium]
MKRRSFLLAAPAVAALASTSWGSESPPTPYGALPSTRQLRWHELQTCAFLHFTVNTFTDREWGEGDEDPKVFNPTSLEPNAIVSSLKAAGMKGVILTCKHHDGFCLWPTTTTDHCIRNSSWRNGKGDVVRDISAAARRHGLAFGVYLSPWDRNNAAYGKSEYLVIYRRQLTELLTQYGAIFEIWFDGANGGTGYYGGARENRVIDRLTYYDWPQTWALARQLQPGAVIFSDVGPDVRWVGNENGVAGETCWETYDPVGEHGGPAAPGNIDARMSMVGTRDGKQWLPPECDVSIRPGWFWHENENGKVKTARDLLRLYYGSVGRGGSFLLNVPPDRRGLLNDTDIASLRQFGELRRTTFARNLAAGARVVASNVRGRSRRYSAENLLDGDGSTYWATDDSVTTPELTLEFRQPVSFNVIRLRENIRLGQRVESFEVEARRAGTWHRVAEATSIGNCRLIRTNDFVTADKVRLRITKSPECPTLSDFGLFAEEMEPGSNAEEPVGTESEREYR